jgi:hypothetical protein
LSFGKFLDAASLNSEAVFLFVKTEFTKPRYALRVVAIHSQEKEV